MLPLNALKTFDTAARYENFSRAADELHVTHTAVSHQIRKLEEWLGTELFLRVGRKVKLSPTGVMLRNRTNPIFDEILNIERMFQVRDRRKSLIVGCVPSIATRWLVPNLQAFSKMHPDIELQVLYAGHDDQLTSSIYDVLISFNAQLAGDLKRTNLISRMTRPVCSRHYLEAAGCPETPADLLGHTLLHDDTKDGWKSWFLNAGVTVERALDGTVFQDFNLLAVSAIAGHGVALCPVDVFRYEIERGDLIELFDTATRMEEYYALWTRQQCGPPAKAFANWFCDVVDGPADG